MWAHEDARYTRVAEETLRHGAQTLLVHVLAKEYPDGQTLREQPRGHRLVMLPPAVDKNAIHPAALFKARLPSGENL